MTDTERDQAGSTYLLRQQLAAIEHERWADWQRWMHGQGIRLSDGGILLTPPLVERWERQIATAYDDLSDSEQKSDLEQVDRYWPLVAAALARAARAEEHWRQAEQAIDLVTAALTARAEAAEARVREMTGKDDESMSRDDLGRVVRVAWVTWAEQQPNPKPSWLVPYDDLSKNDKEADRMIGSAVAGAVADRWEVIADSWRTSYRATEDRAKRLEAEIAALIAAGDGLWQFTDHLTTCAITRRNDDPEIDPDTATCDCGYQAAVAAWEQAKGGQA